MCEKCSFLKAQLSEVQSLVVALREALGRTTEAVKRLRERAPDRSCMSDRTAQIRGEEALSNSSATAQRVKDEWEREAVEKVIGTITDPANEIVWIRPAQGSIHADPRFIRAAILGEKP